MSREQAPGRLAYIPLLIKNLTGHSTHHHGHSEPTFLVLYNSNHVTVTFPQALTLEAVVQVCSSLRQLSAPTSLGAPSGSVSGPPSFSPWASGRLPRCLPLLDLRSLHFSFEVRPSTYLLCSSELYQEALQNVEVSRSPGY